MEWHPGLVPVSVGEGLVVVDPTTQQSTAVNASSALIALSFDGSRDCAELAGVLAAEVGLDAADMGADVLAAAGDLRDRGIIQQVVDTRRRRFDRTVLAGGTRIRVRTDVGEVAEIVEPLLAALPVSERRVCDLEVRAERRFFVTLRDGEEAARATTPEQAVIDVLHELGQRVINDSVGTIRLHAGAVERDGRSLLLVGSSGKGKSTLTAALVQRGWGYLTDEVAIIDQVTRGVVPYPKALDLEAHSLFLLGIEAPDQELGAHKAKVLPATIGGLGAAGAKAELVVLVAEDPEKVDPITAFLKMMDAVFAPTVDDPGCLEAMARICEEIPVVGIRRGEPVDMADAVEALVAELER